jgi:sugar O-acyltransferase (sialic acid O-acetyltransferase NeuD family)
MTRKPGVLVVGASGHARVVLDAIERAGRYRVLGLIADGRKRGEREGAYRVLGGEAEFAAIASRLGARSGVIAIGDNWQRDQVRRRLLRQAPRFSFVTIVHPAAVVARGAALGAGTVVMAGAVINPGAAVGECCIVNTGASLDHDCRMGNFSSLAPGAVVGGNVRIGRYTAIGLGASVIHRRKIGEHAVVGAGAVVLEDLPARCVAYGVPARNARPRKPGDPYL